MSSSTLDNFVAHQTLRNFLAADKRIKTNFFTQRKKQKSCWNRFWAACQATEPKNDSADSNNEILGPQCLCFRSDRIVVLKCARSIERCFKVEREALERFYNWTSSVCRSNRDIKVKVSLCLPTRTQTLREDLCSLNFPTFSHISLNDFKVVGKSSHWVNSLKSSSRTPDDKCDRMMLEIINKAFRQVYFDKKLT